MHIIPLIDEILAYYDGNRGVGHTRAAINGAGAENALFLTSYRDQALRVHKQDERLELITLQQVANGSLRGKNRPMVADHGALTTLLTEARRVILNAQVRKEKAYTLLELNHQELERRQREIERLETESKQSKADFLRVLHHLGFTEESAASLQEENTWWTETLRQMRDGHAAPDLQPDETLTFPGVISVPAAGRAAGRGVGKDFKGAAGAAVLGGGSLSEKLAAMPGFTAASEPEKEVQAVLKLRRSGSQETGISQLVNLTSEIDRLKAELQAVTEERDEAVRQLEELCRRC